MSVRSALAKAALSVIGPDAFGSILSSNGMSAPPRLGTNQLLKAYSTMPWLRACVQKTSWSVATNRWQLFVAQQGTRAIRDDIMAKSHNTRQRHDLIRKGLNQGSLREVTSNAFLDFLAVGTPPYFNGLMAAQLTAQYQDLVGESLWVIERKSIGGANGRGTPLSFWVIPPSWVQSTPTLGHPFFHIIGPQGARVIPASDAVWWYQPDPANPYGRGSGMGHVLGDELETDGYAAKYTKAFFYNDARPPFVVSLDGADKTEVDRMSTWWQTKHQGFGRWWKPGFIGRKMEVHEFGHSMKDMGMRELREFERNTILQVYGNPPEIFGITESSNRATAEAAKAIYAEHVVEPRLEFKRAGLQSLAETEFDERLIVEFVTAVPEDRAHTLEVMKSLTYAFKIDEHRMAANHPPIEDGSGQVHMVPFTVTAKARLDEEDEPEPEPEPFLDDAEDEPDLDDAEDDDAEEASFTKGLKPKDATKVVNAASPQTLIGKTKPVIRGTVKSFGQDMLDALDTTLVFDMRNPRVEDFLAEWAGDRIRDKVNATTRDRLREQLRDGVANGESLAKLTKRVQSVFKTRSASDAVMIAKTEIGRASNFGAWVGMKQAGIEKKEWLATSDERTRDTHTGLDGTIVGIDEMFVSSSGARGMYPGEFGVAEEDVRCRCNVLSVFDDKATSTDRGKRWKANEAERKPFDRQMEAALKSGFKAQQDAVLKVLRNVFTE